MLDPHTGLRVPVLAVTHDLRTNEVVAVGGCMLDPETRLMKPIQIGDIMEDPESRSLLIIMGVKIDEATGCVKPIGAKCVDEGTGADVAMVFGAPMLGEFSGAPCKACRCISDPFNPSRTLAVDDDLGQILEAAEDDELSKAIEYLERQVLFLQSRASGIRSTATLGSMHSAVKKDTDWMNKMNAMAGEANVKYQGFQAVRAALNKVTLDRVVLVREQHQRMYDMAETGGQKGSLVDPITERELPILVGCCMYDEASKSDVQILALEINEDTGLYEPLGCTVIDPLSGRQVSATICGQIKDLFSGNVVPISRLRRDPSTYAVNAESNLRPRHSASASSSANIDSKLLADLLKQLATSSSGSGALANLLGDLGHTPRRALSAAAASALLGGTPTQTSALQNMATADAASSDTVRHDAAAAGRRHTLFLTEEWINVAPDAKASHIERLKRLLEEFRAEEDEGVLAAAFEGLVAAAVHRFLKYSSTW